MTSLPKETFRDKVMSSPEMTDDMWGELATLFDRYTCIRSFFGFVLAEGNNQVMSLPNVSTATEEGREQAALMRGAIRNGQWIVGASCDNMGDKFLGDQEPADDEPKAKRPAPVKKRARVAPAKRSKK